MIKMNVLLAKIILPAAIVAMFAIVTSAQTAQDIASSKIAASSQNITTFQSDRSNNNKLLSQIVPNDLVSKDSFGYSVAVEENYGLISAVHSDAKGTDSGAVYLFDFNSGQQLKKFMANDGSAGDLFGYSVAIKGTYVLISAAYSDAKGTDSGAVYLFDLNSGQQLKKFMANDGSAGDLFGYSVAIEDNYGLIGSAYDDDRGRIDKGSAYLFNLSTGQQIQQF